MNPKVKYTEISANRFSPVVLKSSVFAQGASYPKGFELKPRYVFDYEIEYYLYSEGAMVIEDKKYPISKGDVVFRRPGQFAQGIMPYTCYLVCFDLLGNTGKDPDTYDIGREQEFQDYYLNPVLDSIPPVLHSPFNEKYPPIFESALQVYLNPCEGSEILLKTYLLQILYQMYMDIKNPFMRNSMPAAPLYPAVKKAVRYINENIRNKIVLEQIAGEARLSPSYFHRIFCSAMNMTPVEYITKLRLDKARELLVKTSLPISEIALQCGFENIPYFNYVFKKHLKTSPGEFRKRHAYI